MSDPNELTEEDLALEEQMKGADTAPPVEEPKTPTEEQVEEEPKGEEPPAEEPKEELTEEEVAAEANEQKMVPLAALHEARGQLKELKTAMETQAEQLKIINDLKAQMEALRAEKAAPKEELPDYEEDPLGHTQAKIKQQEETIENLKLTQDQIQEYNEQMRFADQVTSLENEFRGTTPDYDAAREFLIDERVKELAAFGVTDQETIQQDIIANLQQISIAATRQRQNPAEAVYKLAEIRGYKKPEAKNEAQNTQAKEDLATIAKGQEVAGKNLSGSGEADVQQTSLQDLIDMDGDEFDREWEKRYASKVRKA